MKSFNEKSVLFLICVVFCFSSCIKPDPGKTQGENALTEKISKESRIPMSIQSFTKTNGIKREVQGQPIYTMEFNAQIRIEQQCGTLGDNPFLKDFMPFEQFKNYIHNIYYVDYRKTIFYSGALLSYDGEITFEKTDNGWRPAASNLKNVKVINNPSPLDKFVGIWYIENSKEFPSYIKFEKDNRGRYIFCEGYMYEKNIVWAEKFDQIPLEFSDGKAISQFSSDGFRPSHGEPLDYSISLTLLPENKLQYSLAFNGGAPETKVFTRFNQ